MKSANKVLSKIEQYFIAILLLIVAVILFINVVLRFFGTSMLWAEELARYAIVWITFVGASVCVYKGAHIGVDVIMNILGEKPKKILSLILALFSLIFSVVFTYFSFKITMNVHNTNQISSTMGIPMSIVYAAMPVGGILMSIRYIQEFISLIKVGENK
ncbi:TRAP transporter small permease [Proteiniborus sp. MB09-C3]|uniref:TRAP transporter small permease n=1 Tax=Proteiniborus sp. MB09-C3 TaxID=3050072 RepID=UPI00255780E3|nr:TRAP transporter small permease [Proteiniborus sp. MB09-C3]WIV13020.1 TRAP transporter small permease [Proteiniborus sp. MB09-C3]